MILNIVIALVVFRFIDKVYGVFAHKAKAKLSGLFPKKRNFILDTLYNFINWL